MCVSDSVLRRAARFAGLAAGVAVLLSLLAFPVAAFASGSGGGSDPTGGAGFGTNPAGSGSAGTTPAPKTGSGSSAHLGDRTLHLGMKGHDVRVLQQFLGFAGYPTAIDGTFGQLTKRSVIMFQQAQSLTPNGLVTYSVQLLLRDAVKAVEASPATGQKARINPDGTLALPADAPPVVQAVVAATNTILNTSYCVGGGHASWTSSCYDCSGAVSFALHGGGLLPISEDSSQMETYGEPGPGQWISIYADAGHAFMVVAGRAFDTANYGGPNLPNGDGPRWRSNPLGNLADGGNYVVRHPAGL